MDIQPLLHILMLVCFGGVVSAGHLPSKCGYESCNPVKEGMINVHLVPHTHDDVGWLKTVDQYYYGSRNNIQNAGVQYVLDSVVKHLLEDPTRRFIYVEIAFFARWWREQTDSMRHVVKGLVNNGQLEFILGGWCMNDEASTHYNAIIDQHSLGFEFLRQNFGECGRPRVAWQIDPFGHSREQASLFAQMGFEGVFFARLDYQDRGIRQKNKTMEMLWHGSPNNLGKKADLFAGALARGSYGYPNGFCWDQFCNDEPIMDDKRLHDVNVDQRVKDFLKVIQTQASQFATDHLMVTMGSDFQYQNAGHWYKNLDKLIKYTNQLQVTNNTKVNLLYSTPSCYLNNLNKAGKTWTTKSDDFFPYAWRAHSFWGGYFTSRAALKGYVRNTNTFLQACKQLDALAMLEDQQNSTHFIQILKEAMGVAQHHDAVSGTEKQHVADDYAMRLSNGRAQCQKVMFDALGKLVPKGSVTFPSQTWCDLLNISACSFTEVNKQFVMTVYNPLGHNVTHWMRLPVIGQAYIVTGPDGNIVETQIVPVTNRTKYIPERKGHMATNELIFQVQLPALGYSTYFIKMSKSQTKKKLQRSQLRYLRRGKVDHVMSNEHLSLQFDRVSGRLSAIVNHASGIAVEVDQELTYYNAMAGNDSAGQFQPSGAYIFRPNGTSPHHWTGPTSSYTVQGPLVQETYHSFSPWLTQVVRLYKGANYAELEWTVGPIPVDDGIGKEAIARFSTNLTTNKVFYTDSNGREILQRVRDHRPTWSLNQSEPVAGNYYPVNSRIYLKDAARDVQFTVLNDRSQGGSSIHDGQVEVMLHRRLLHDDGLGVGEPLNEKGSDHKGLIVRGKLFIVVDTKEASPRIHREMALRQYMDPIPSFSDITTKYSEYASNFNVEWSGLAHTLPPNVHLLTLEQWGGPTIQPAPIQPYLVRLEHFFEKDEDPDLSVPVTVSLQNLFVPFKIETVEELTLGANLAISDLHRMTWNTTDNIDQYEDIIFSSIYDESVSYQGMGASDILLKPMEIRTFQVTLQHSKPQKKGDKFMYFS